MVARYRYSPGIRASQLLERRDAITAALASTEPCIGPMPTPDPLTRAQEIALLTLRHSDHGNQVVAELLKRGQRRAQRADYESLVPLGLAGRDRQGYHGITPKGSWRARLIAQAIAVELRIVLVDYRRAMRRGAQRIHGMSDSGNW